MSGRTAFYLSRCAFKPFHQQVIKVPADAINRKDVEVMYMKFAIYMGLPDLRRVDFIQPINLAYLRGYIVV